MKKLLSLLILVVVFFGGCGGGGDSVAPTSVVEDSKYTLDYKGLSFFVKDMPSTSYKLDALDDSDFNALKDSQKLLVADKLLSTLFFAYDFKTLKQKISTGRFISDTFKSLYQKSKQREWIENYITDENKFIRYVTTQQEATDILARFYAFKELDNYYLNNWIAYILTQTIMFSPAYELDSSHNPNIARVYNRLVNLLEDEGGMRYITYLHMMSEDNWRRFRSPEDNGREMLEIYTLDTDDTHVPIAGKALQNWKLDRDNDTLIIGLNENTEPLKLFGTTIYNGDDFYRELVKSDSFINGSVERLVRFFFEDSTEDKIIQIKNSIVSSKPETWQDVLLQIVFSKEYLLYTTRPKSAEETYFSLAKKVHFLHNTRTIYNFKRALDDMHQASMKYKLGKLTRVPLDTLSFAVYHKTIREEMMIRHSNSSSVNKYERWDRQGWSDIYIDDTNFLSDASEPIKSLESMIKYLFNSTIARDVKKAELDMFKAHMVKINDDGNEELLGEFNLVRDDKYKDSSKRNVTYLVLDYITRLDTLYLQQKVK
ncbi:MAG: hypothetical protein GXO30_04525 [Epsilonproteobacteria bacterium]|nr:hypothetical protein [Campylobacterota bacterium]